MSLSDVAARISSLKNEVSTLDYKKKQLSTALIDAYNLLDSINDYKNKVESSKDSINAVFGSFSWEGQTVKNFETLYGSAVDDLQCNVVRKHRDIVSNIEDEISAKQLLIDSKNDQISYLQSEYNRLLAEQNA